jgi:hypothetical protein
MRRFELEENGNDLKLILKDIFTLSNYQKVGKVIIKEHFQNMGLFQSFNFFTANKYLIVKIECNENKELLKAYINKLFSKQIFYEVETRLDFIYEIVNLIESYSEIGNIENLYNKPMADLIVLYTLAKNIDGDSIKRINAILK